MYRVVEVGQLRAEAFAADLLGLGELERLVGGRVGRARCNDAVEVGAAWGEQMREEKKKKREERKKRGDEMEKEKEGEEHGGGIEPLLEGGGTGLSLPWW